jgi:uncharacterized membrane protein
MMLALGLFFAAANVAARTTLLTPLGRFGRHSLFIYWIHVDLVYGYATWPIHRGLPLPATLAASVLFCGVMYGALHVRDRVASAFNRRHQPTNHHALQT